MSPYRTNTPPPQEAPKPMRCHFGLHAYVTVEEDEDWETWVIEQCTLCGKRQRVQFFLEHTERENLP